MPRIIPFAECIARPKDDQEDNTLSTHLIHAKEYLEQWEQHDKILARLLGLAGLCHDIAKARNGWQDYINGKMKKGPTHAPAGAYFFSYMGYHLLHAMGAWEDYQKHWLQCIRDLADHHGDLADLQNDSWVGDWAWDEMDLSGICTFIHDVYEELRHIEIDIQSLEDWSHQVEEYREDVSFLFDASQTGLSYLEMLKELQRWRHRTTGLTAADRFDITKTVTTVYGTEDLQRCKNHLEGYLMEKSGSSLSDVRERARRQLLSQFGDQSDKRIFTVELPTGYGKTITTLSLAVMSAMANNYSKIVYVAPYLSILEQTAGEVKKVLNEQALEHHSLALKQENVPDSQLAMESWAHRMICTSFQQFSKAIFPKRSQQTLRRVFLKDSIVIIDEPQIFEPNGWNLLLCGIEALAEEYNLQVFFLSATMPPFQYGLTKEPIRLTYHEKSPPERYAMHINPPMDEKQWIDYIANQPYGKQASIVNTIADAIELYELSCRHSSDMHTLVVHGMMLPIHKRIMIEHIRDILKNYQKGDRKLHVVSTQVLEAGVDVSFEHLARALAIMPSLIQGAGRVNRHNELGMGILSVILFLRHGKKDTRFPIYPRNLTKITEELLSRQPIWKESDTNALLQEYFKKMFRENTYETQKQAIISAFEGNWPEIARYQPFGANRLMLPLFIPWDTPDEWEKFTPPVVRILQKQFDVKGPLEIYDRYRDRKFMKSLDFSERKHFMILFYHYVLQISPEKALEITSASKEDYLEGKIPLLYDEDLYVTDRGLDIRSESIYDNII